MRATTTFGIGVSRALQSLAVLALLGMFGCHAGKNDLVGTWKPSMQAASAGSNPQAAMIQQFAQQLLQNMKLTLTEDGKFTLSTPSVMGIPASTQTGTWKADGSTLKLHVEQKNGQGVSDIAKAFNLDAKQQKQLMQSEAKGNDATMTISEDHKTLTMAQQGNKAALTITFTKQEEAAPGK